MNTPSAGGPAAVEAGEVTTGPLVVVVNPASAGGRTGRRWPALLAALREAGLEPEVRVTRGPGDAIRITREAVAGGAGTVVAVGGDGTVGEVVNGLVGEHGRLAPVAVGIVPGGTGGDLRRCVGIPAAPAEAAATISAGAVRSLDVGRITFGDGSVRHFVNIADCGVGGDVVARVNAGAHRAGGTPTFLYHAVVSLMTYGSRRVVLELDGRGEELDVQNVVVANGTTFGGGMRVAPGADPSDGAFDVVVIGASSRPSTLLGMARIYAGRHLGHPGVSVHRARRVTVTAAPGERPLRFDVDGEAIGTTPAVLECLPRALRLIVPRSRPG